VKPRRTVEQEVRPGIPGICRRSEPPDVARQPAGLGIDEPGRHRVPEPVALAAGAVEPASHQVGEPAVELVETRRDLPFA
jgi:hypothetical protein